jgi:hypothetical protein
MDDMDFRILQVRRLHGFPDQKHVPLIVFDDQNVAPPLRPIVTLKPGP